MWSSLAQFFVDHIWTSKFLIALVVVSPKVATTGAAFALRRAFDRRIKAATTEYEECLRRLANLEIATQSLEQFQLLRASFLIVLASNEAEMDWAKRIDRLFRTSAQGAARRIVAELSPDTWQARMCRTDEILAGDYEQAAVAELQAFETEIDLEARAGLTSLQARLHDLADRKAALEARKARWANGLDSLGTILAIVAFFVGKA